MNFNLTDSICEAVKKAQKGQIYFKEIFDNSDLQVANNEFLFFIKPEITVESDTIQLKKILELIQNQIKTFGLNVHNVKLLSSEYLEQYSIISQHYGVINKIATNAVEYMSETAKDKFLDLYGKSIYDLKVMGGIEFLNYNIYFNAYVLDYLWQNKENLKLAGGTYCEDIKVDDEIIYLINGFHPRQLKHFTERGRSIVVMTLSGDLSWKVARNDVIGATNPAKANEGSIRRELLENKISLGLPEVSQGMNGVHLSAGPVEALIELRRYNSDFRNENKIINYENFSFGKELYKNFSDDIVSRILENDNLVINNKNVSIFEYTEEMNSDEALHLLRQFYK